MVMPPSQRVLYQSDDNAKLKGFIKALETSIDLSQFGAMGATAITGIAANKGAISNSAIQGVQAVSPAFKTLEKTVVEFSKGMSDFVKSGGIKKIIQPFEAISNAAKTVTPQVLKDFFSTFKPITDLLKDLLKTAKPALQNFFKSLSQVSSNLYDATKTKLGTAIQGSKNRGIVELENQRANLQNKGDNLNKKINELNKKFTTNQEINKKTPINDFNKIQDGLKTKSVEVASEIKSNETLLKQYDELLASKNKLYQLEIDLKKLKLDTGTLDKKALGDLQRQAQAEIKKQETLINNLKGNLDEGAKLRFENEKVIRRAENQLTGKLITNKSELNNIQAQKKALNENFGKAGTDTVNIKNFDADERSLTRLIAEEEKLNKVIQEQENVLTGLNKARQQGSTVALQNTDDAIKLATELNKTTVAMQNLGKAFQAYVKITDTFLTGTSIAKAFITLQEGIQDVTREAKNAGDALLLMQKQGFDISGFDELSKIKDIMTLNTQVTSDFVTSTVARFNEFEENLRRVGTVFETDLNMEERTANLQEFGMTIQNLVNNSLKNTVTETEALAATYEALSAGFTSATSSTQVMKAGLKLAASSGADSGEVMRLLSKTLNAYGKDASEAAKVAAQLNTIVENGITTVAELSGGFGQLSTVANAVGIDLEEAGAALAVLTTKGTSTAQAMTQLQSLFTAFIDPEFSKRLEDLKIDLKINKSVVETKGLVTVLKELDEAVGGNAVKWGQLLPEIQAYRAALSLTSDGVTKLETVTKKMVDTTAQQLENVFNIRLDDNQITKFTQIVNKLNSTLINVGRSLAPIMEQSINFVSLIANNISKWVEANLGLVKTMASITLGLKAFEGVTKSVIGTLGGLLGIFTTWRFLTGKLLPDLGALFVTSKKGMEAMALAQQNGAKWFELFGIGLKNNALLSNQNLSIWGKFTTVLGNLTGLGAKSGKEIQALGQATADTAKKFQGMWATEKLFRGIQNSFSNMREGNVKLGESVKALGTTLKNTTLTGLNIFGNGINLVGKGLKTLFLSPVIPTGVGLLGALAAAAYGVSKGFEIIEKKKESLKASLSDVKQSIKDTTQTLNSLSFGKVRIEDLSANDIKKQLEQISDISIGKNDETLKQQADKFLQANQKNLASLEELQNQRDALLSRPVPDNSPHYAEYTNKLKDLNNQIAQINSDLTKQLGKDLEVRVLTTQSTLEKLLDAEQQYLNDLVELDKHYKVTFFGIGEAISDYLSSTSKKFEGFGFAIEDTFKGIQRFVDDIFGGNLGEKIELDKTYALIEKLNTDLNSLQQQYAENLIGNYKYENLILDGKKLEIDLQKELNNLWKEQGNIQTENYSKFTKTISAIKEELDTQQKAIKKNIELTNTAIASNQSTINNKYSLSNLLGAKQRDEYSNIYNNEDRITYLKEDALINLYTKQNNKSASEWLSGNSSQEEKAIKSFLPQIREILQDDNFINLSTEKERKDYLNTNRNDVSGLVKDFLSNQNNFDILQKQDIKELEKSITTSFINERGKEFYKNQTALEQMLKELQDINKGIEKANQDLNLIAKAGEVLNNRVDLSKPNSLSDRKTREFGNRQKEINDTISAVELVSKGALYNQNFRNDFLTEEQQKTLTKAEQDAILSSEDNFKKYLTSNVTDYTAKVNQAYIDFLQNPKNQKLLEGLTEEQKYQEFYKGDSSKYTYTTKVSDLQTKAANKLGATESGLTQDQIDALLNASELPTKILDQAQSIFDDLEEEFITAEQALKRFDENIMKVRGDVGTDNIAHLLKARIDLVRAANAELLEEEQKHAQKMETLMSGIFGESAKQMEAIASIRLKTSKSNLQTEKEIYDQMVEDGVWTEMQLKTQKDKIEQMSAELLVQEFDYLNTKGNIRSEEINKTKQHLELLQSTEFTFNKSRIDTLERLDQELLKNAIKTKKEQLINLQNSNSLTTEQIREFRESIIQLEEQYNLKELTLEWNKYQKRYEEREKAIQKYRTKIEQYSELELVNEEDKQKQLNNLQQQSIQEYGTYLNNKLNLVKQNGGDTEEILIQIQQNEFELEKAITERLKIEFEQRIRLRSEYYARLKEEQETIKENLQSLTPIVPQATEFLESRKSTSGSALEQLNIEKQIINLKKQSLDSETQMKQRLLEIDTNLLNLEKEERIEAEQTNLLYSDSIVKQKEKLVLEAETPEKLKLANEQLELAKIKREEIKAKTEENITNIKLEYLEQEKQLDLLRQTVDINKEVASKDLEIAAIQNKYNIYQERLNLYQQFLALSKDHKMSVKEQYEEEKRQLQIKQEIEKKLFDLETKKLELKYKGLEIEGKITIEKTKQENILLEEENRRISQNIESLRGQQRNLTKGRDYTELSQQEKDKYDSLKNQLKTQEELLESNTKIINSNLELVETQKENNKLLKQLIQDTNSQKQAFNQKQNLEKANLYKNQNVSSEDKRIGEDIIKNETSNLKNQLSNHPLSGERKRSTLGLLNLNISSDGTIKNFKSGGKVTPNDLIKEIKNTENPYEVLALGKQVLKALEREGDGAVPLVANKDEFILNKEETKVLEQLKASGIWDFFKNKKIQNFKDGGFVTNHRGQKIPDTVHKQLLNTPEGTTTRLTLNGEANYYLRTREGVNKVGIGDKYTPSNSNLQYTVKLNSGGFPVLMNNNETYKAGSPVKTIPQLQYQKQEPKTHEADPDYKYRVIINRTTVDLPIYGYLKNGQRFYKIIKDGKLIPTKLNHGDVFLGQKFFVNKTNKLEGYLGFHTPQEWARLNKIDEDQLNRVRKGYKDSGFVRPASAFDIQQWNANTAPKLDGFNNYVADAEFALYRKKTTGEYYALEGEREEDMFFPSYVRNSKGEIVRQNNKNKLKLKPISISDGFEIRGKIFFKPESKELQNKRGFYSKEEYAKLKEEEKYYLAHIKRGSGETIRGFNSGGKVFSTNDLDNLVSNAKVNEAEVFNLGKEMLKAIHKEGEGAVPLVANKDEYILNKEETKILTKLKDTGIWDVIKQNIDNYRLGGEIKLENNNEIPRQEYFTHKDGSVQPFPDSYKQRNAPRGERDSAGMSSNLGGMRNSGFDTPTKKLEIDHKITVEAKKTGEQDMDMLMDIVEKKVKMVNDNTMRQLEMELQNKI